MSVQKHSQDNDEGKKLPKKKGKTLQPLHEDALKKQLANDKEAAQSNADMLAELAAKTAALAEQVRGKEGPANRTLKLDEELQESHEPKDIFEELDEKKLPKRIVSLPRNTSVEDNPAVDLVRQKLNKLFGNEEPDALEEAAEAMSMANNRSKHQQFMYELTNSGKSLAEIQTAWHDYYVELPNDEKHAVWQEFYTQHDAMSSYAQHEKKKQDNTYSKPEAKSQKDDFSNNTSNTKKARSEAVKTQIIDSVTAKGRLTPVQHAKSLLFGLGLAGAVGLVIVFLFFNQVFVAPFISPSKTVSATPIIGNVNAPVSDEDKIIIPKINLEVPIVFDIGSVAESAIQDALEDGVAHFAASPEPGEIGNSVIVGHSSNNILNAGRYKFAFVLLSRLEEGDTFFVHKDSVRYTYKVYEEKIVPPDDVSVLGEAEKPNSITLITCDPPGTSINRLIIVAEQISPDPQSNKKATIDLESETVVDLPSNAPSLWSRINPFN
jgi:sortase A